MIITRTLINAVIMNNTPMTNAAFLRFRLLMGILLFPWYDEINSKVISRIIDVTARKKLRSQKDRENCISKPYSASKGIKSYLKEKLLVLT
jgi:hypothetical protein